jgi:hypothetical protein
MVAATSETNFLYRVEAGSSTYHFSGVAMDQTVDGQVYDYVQVQHTIVY